MANPNRVAHASPDTASSCVPNPHFYSREQSFLPVPPAAHNSGHDRPVRIFPAPSVQREPSILSSAPGSGRISNTLGLGVSSASRPPTIRLRRLPSLSGLNAAYSSQEVLPTQQHLTVVSDRTSHTASPSTKNRPRSVSDPAQRSWRNDQHTIRASQVMSPVQEVPPHISATPPTRTPVQVLPETGSKATVSQLPSAFSLTGAKSLLGMKQRMEDIDRTISQPPLPPAPKPLPPVPSKEYNQDIVDLLDVIDPEVSTLSTLTNVQNSLFIPNLGKYLNRHPTYDLSFTGIGRSSRRGSGGSPISRVPTIDALSQDGEPLPLDDGPLPWGSLRRQQSHAMSITSNLTESHFAVLPHGVSINDWTDDEKEMLDDHVRHLLHSKREKFKRTWRGFKQYVKRPVGFLVTLYATLITLFGLAWVLFLIGWIYVGEKQLYAINVIDNILVALFAIVGDGLAPFRAVDTYHMIFIAHYHFLTWKLRRKRSLPKLENPNDLPTRRFVSVEADRQSVLQDLEAAWEKRDEQPVLTDEQQERFEHHSMKFAKSHTYYRPHETRTHRAFPIKLLIVVTVLLDCHSMFQIALGGVTWGISYHKRPGALTATILSCSIACNVAAGITISIGDRISRKKQIIEQEFRQDLTEEAIGHVKKKVEKSDEEKDEIK